MVRGMRTARNFTGNISQITNDDRPPNVSAVIEKIYIIPSLAVQSEKESSDINVIVKRFGLTGAMPPNPRVPHYGDFEGVDDFQSAMEAVRRAQEDFLALPPDLRSRFGNDPQGLLEFVENPDNYEEAVKLGLANPRPVVSNTPVPDFPGKERSNERSNDAGVDGGAKASDKSGKDSK